MIKLKWLLKLHLLSLFNFFFQVNIFINHKAKRRPYTRGIPTSKGPTNRYDSLKKTPYPLYNPELHGCAKNKYGIGDYSSIAKNSILPLRNP